MLSIILGILSSGGFGSIVGLVGGYFNRKLDLAAKKIDSEDREKQRAHDLVRMDKDRVYMNDEYAARLQVADKEIAKVGVEADGAIEVAGYGAMADSYKFAAPTSSDGRVDKLSKLIRPLVTLGFLFFTVYIFYVVQGLVGQLQVQPDADMVFKLYVDLIMWVTFQAGVCVGWWFAMRPGRHPVSS